MISNEQLREFILHEDADVRREAACYFYEGHIQDPHILPLTIQACQEYGFDNCVSLLFHANRQVVDDFSAAKLLDALRETEHENSHMQLVHLLNNASIGFLEKNIDSMPTRISEKQWSIAQNRLTFDSYSAEQLWQALKDYSEESENSKTDASYHGPLINLLAEYDYPSENHICELLQDDEIVGQWLELFLIQLAGARKMEQAVPVIDKKLSEDDLQLTDACSKALSAIGSETVVHALKEGCRNNTWGYQISAADILGRIKRPQSEKAIIELLENNTETLPRDVYAYLCFGLCDLFSDKAFHYGKEILDDIETIEIDSMRERLIVCSTIMDTPLSEETRRQWEKDIASEAQRRMEHRKKTRPELHKLGELFRHYVDGNSGLGEMDPLDENTSYPRITDNSEPPLPQKKVGRNEPCPCASGKKYKKCCGKIGIAP